ncbi:MAG TPA: hypothetical protein VFQ40_01835 [Actinomycetota bacterium]|nr:hypothetical protein [Actinomycetota bacterium]
MEVIIELVKYAVIFGILATAPLVLWLGAAWLFTDRRRSPSRPEPS